MSKPVSQPEEILKPCRLCGEKCVQQLSHVIPAFVFRWLKTSSGNGHVRSSKEPDVRTQDGVKRYWMCTNCEQRFSDWEGQFASKIFHPYTNGLDGQLPYEDWLLRFATSISWRVLTFALDEVNLNDWSKEKRFNAMAAEKAWREFLLGKSSHPGEFRQLILPMGEVSGSGPDTPENINRYLMRAVELDVPSGGEFAFTFTKMGRFIFIGQIMDPAPNQWRSARINANQGVIGPKQHTLPIELWNYLKGRARNTSEALASMSVKQQEKVKQAFESNIDRYIKSDAFKAMNADVSSFGSKAFAPSKDGSS